jgi:hypothetical protein
VADPDDELEPASTEEAMAYAMHEQIEEWLAIVADVDEL